MEHKILKVAVIYKKSLLESMENNSFNKLPKKEQQKIKTAHKSHYECILFIESFLSKKNISFKIIERQDVTAKKLKNNFVITVGGDGTLLDTSHYIKDEIILGVNSHPKSSVGALCACNKESFAEVFKQSYFSAENIFSANRLKVNIDGKDYKILALNEFLIANKNPGLTSRYSIEVEKQKETHKSSGIWIASSLGSSGAILSAGGKLSPFLDDSFQYLVREPYTYEKADQKNLKGFLTQKDNIKLQVLCENMALYIDGGHKCLSLNFWSKVVISSFGLPLLMAGKSELLSKRKQLLKIFGK